MGKILSSVWARLQDRFFFFVVKLWSWKRQIWVFHYSWTL
jgi:hypothetical protein